MECPKCNKQIIGISKCMSCNLDVELFGKIINISNRFYNEGLINAKENKLTDAIISLNKSINMNKNNYIARNLLGLVYMNVGYLGEALKQWIVSKSIKKEDNRAEIYLDAIQNDNAYLEKANENIKLYNEVLRTLRNKEIEIAIAITALKKVVNNNPKFIDALNLLSLCYIEEHNKTGAKKYIESVLSIDSANKIAFNYYKDSFANSTQVSVLPTMKTTHRYELPNYSADKTKQYKAKNNKLFLSCTLSIFFTLLLVGSIIIFVVVPFKTKNLKVEIAELSTKLQKSEEKYLKTIEEKDLELERYKTENDNFKLRISEIDAKESMEKKIMLIDEVEKLAVRGDKLKIANMIYSEDFSGVPEEYASRLEIVKTKVYNSVCKTIYNEALVLFKNKEYSEASVKFKEALKFSIEGNIITPDIIYNLGLIAEVDADFENAKKYFNEIIEKYPNYKQIFKVNEKLENL